MSLNKKVELCAGPMTLKEINNEIKYYLLSKNPKSLVVEIEKKSSQEYQTKYQTTIYMVGRNFK